MSICSRPYPNCSECGDVLIHQSNRGPHESSSAFGQYVHDRLGNEMYWLDVDGVIYKKKTQILRIIEHKPHLGRPSDSQKYVLPLIAKAVQLLSATGLIHKQSGVFYVFSDHPHEVVLVEQVKGWSLRSVMAARQMSGTEWRSFLLGEEIA